MRVIIDMTCQTCKTVHEVKKTDEIPDDVIRMTCNWCPQCEDSAEAVYEEWYIFNPDTMKYLKRCSGAKIAGTTMEYCYSCKRHDIHHGDCLVENISVDENCIPYCNHYIKFNYVPTKR